MSQTTTKPTAKSKKNKKRTGGGAKTEPEAGRAPELAKKKQPQKPLSPAKQLAALQKAAVDRYQQSGEEAEAVMYGGKKGGPVAADMLFDSAVLNQRAASFRQSLKVVRADPAKFAAERGDGPNRGALDRLTERVRETRRIADGIAELEHTAANLGDGVDLAADPLVSASWQQIQARKAAVNRDGIDALIAEVGARLKMMGEVIDAINGVDGADQVAKIPGELVTAAGTSQPLKVLHDLTRLEPDRDVVRKLLDNADVKGNVASLLRLARKPEIDADLDKVLTACGKNTTTAEKLLKTVQDSGKNAKYFTNEGDTDGPEDGLGGQLLDDLRIAGLAEASVWTGQTVDGATLRFGTEENPMDVDTIRQVAEQQEVGGGLPDLPDGEPPRDRYVGGQGFVNRGVNKGMVLPRWDHQNGEAIEYTEYDVRPYTGADRGKERIVRGSDGHVYHTKDHYITFARMT